MNPTIALQPGRLSTLSYSAWPTPFEGIATKSYDFEACPTWGLNSAFNSTMSLRPEEYLTVGAPWNPIILPPQELLDLDPAWKLCEWVTDGGEYGFFYGAFDPPHILTSMTGMADPMSPASHSMTGNADPVAWTNTAAPAPSGTSILPPTSMDRTGSGIASSRYQRSSSLNAVHASQDPIAIATPNTNGLPKSLESPTDLQRSASSGSSSIYFSLPTITPSGKSGEGSQHASIYSIFKDPSKTTSTFEYSDSGITIQPSKAMNPQVSGSKSQGLAAMIMSGFGAVPDTRSNKILESITLVQVTFMTTVSNGQTIVESKKETIPAPLSTGTFGSAGSDPSSSIQSARDQNTNADPTVIAFNHTTLTVGGPGATLSGIPVSFGTAGLLLGSTTIDLSLMVSHSLITIDGHTLAVTNVNMPSVVTVRTSVSDSSSTASADSPLSTLSHPNTSNTQGSFLDTPGSTSPNSSVGTYVGGATSQAPLSNWTVGLIATFVCVLFVIETISS